MSGQRFSIGDVNVPFTLQVNLSVGFSHGFRQFLLLIEIQREILRVKYSPFFQSCSKPFTYAVGLNELGADEVHKYVGQEPSGRMFNELTLDFNGN